MAIPIDRIRSRDSAPGRSLSTTVRDESHSRSELRRFLEKAEPDADLMLQFLDVVDGLVETNAPASEVVRAFDDLAKHRDPQKFNLRDQMERIRRLAKSHMQISEMRRRTRPNHAPSAEQQELSMRLARILVILGEYEPSELKVMLIAGLADATGFDLTGLDGADLDTSEKISQLAEFLWPEANQAGE